MIMIKKNFLKMVSFSCALLLFIGCQSIMKSYYGIKDPKLENKNTINHYLKTNQITLKEKYILKNFGSFMKFSNNVMIPNAYFYNKNGIFIDYNKSSKSCNADVASFFNDLKNIDQEKNDGKTLQELLNFVVKDTGLPAEFNSGYDVYILITWAKFGGATNKEKAFEWQEILESNDFGNLKVKYYMINCDFQQSWSDLPKDLDMKVAK